MTEWYDRQIAAQQDIVSALQDGAVKVAAFARQFADARGTLREGEDSPLAPGVKMAEAEERFRKAYATATSSSATETETESARQLLLQLGPQLVAMEKAASGQTASALFNLVDGVFRELGDATALGVDTADRQLETAQNTLKELQKARTDAANLGQRQLANLDSLRNTMDLSYAVWQSALGPLQNLTGTAPTAARYAASAHVQSAWDQLSDDQRTGALRNAGYSQTVSDGYYAANLWVAQGHQAAFESALLAAARNAGIAGFATGGISRGPQLAMVSEGAYAAEAHVPLPDGQRIPVALSLRLPALDAAPPSPTIAFRRPDLCGEGGAGVAELVAAVEGLRAEVRAIGDADRTQRARIGGDAAALLERIEAATADLPKKLANTRRAA